MKKKNWFFTVGTTVWMSVTAAVLAILIVFTALCVPDTAPYHPILATVAGGKTPIFGDDMLDIYQSDYESKTAAVEAGNALNVEIAEEGFTLLLNEDNALPLERGSKISVFGKNSVNLVYGGSGSGGGGVSGASTIFDGLEAGGFEYNTVLREFYESSASGGGRSRPRGGRIRVQHRPQGVLRKFGFGRRPLGQSRTHRRLRCGSHPRYR